MRAANLKCAVILFLISCLPAAGTVRAGETEQEQKERLIKEKVRQNTAESFVIVHYHLKKSERPEAPRDDAFYSYIDSTDREYLDNILAKQTLDYTGVIVSSEGEIFIADNYIRPDVIEKITVTGPDGKTVEAKPDRVLVGSCGQILKLSQPSSAGWKPLQFAEAPKKINIKTKFYGIRMLLDSGQSEGYYWQRGFQDERSDGKQYFYIWAAEPYKSRTNGGDLPDNFSLSFVGTTIICDANGQVLGVTSYGRIDTDKDAPLWQGKDVLADKGINREESEKQIKERVSPYLYQVKITFRPPPKEDDEYDTGGFYRRYFSGGSEGQKEMYVYGLAVTPKTLLLPVGMEQTLVEGIDSISVMVSDKYEDAKLGGTLKECQATIVEVNEPKFDSVVDIKEDVGLKRGQPFWTVFVRELAGRDLVMDYNRWLWQRQGYENKYFPIMENSLQAGCWLFDKNGQFAGLYTAAKHPCQRIIPYLKGESSEYYAYSNMPFGRFVQRFSRGFSFYGGEDTRIYNTAFLVSIIKDMSSHYDKFIRRLTRDEQKRRVWLGVEFTSVDKETAKHLNLRKFTQDGRIGLMVSRVYPNSPAAKMGLAEGDVLLKITVPQAPWPIELKQEREYNYGGPDYDEADIPEEFQNMGYRQPRKCPWPSQDNVLTRMLKVIGEGMSVKLTYVHNGEVLDKDFIIKQAPRDSLSASKYKDEKLGLTVKDLTYEVRAALKLAEDANAVVISKVEQGTPAALARINQFELIRAIDGQETGNVNDFETAIKKARDEKKQSVRLTVEWMGKTRLADLKFDAPAKNWEDMMKFIPNMRDSNEAGSN